MTFCIAFFLGMLQEALWPEPRKTPFTTKRSNGVSTSAAPSSEAAQPFILDEAIARCRREKAAMVSEAERIVHQHWSRR